MIPNARFVQSGGRALYLSAILLLAGCAHPQVQIVTKEVKVPISVPCRVAEPAVPSYAADAVSLDADLFTLVRALLSDRETAKAEAVELRAAVKACQ